MNNPVPEHHLFSNLYNDTFKSFLMFNLKSFLGRTFYNDPAPLKTERENFLNLGCGSIFIKDWINCDFFVFRAGAKRPDWMQDFRYPLNCPSNALDGILSEHVIEHLVPSDSFKLLKEAYRVLKPGSYLRLSCPDLAKYIRFYNDPSSVDPIFSRNWSTGTEGIRALTQNWGHRSLWDFKLLERLLGEIGFKNIKQVRFREGADSRLLHDHESREWESLYLEAQK